MTPAYLLDMHDLIRIAGQRAWTPDEQRRAETLVQDLETRAAGVLRAAAEPTMFEREGQS